GAGGAQPLQSSNCALEIRRLGQLWHGARRYAAAFGGHESEIGRPLVVRRRRSALVVKADISLSPDQCPLYPQKQTLVERVGTSALCQKRTARRNTSLFDHFVGAGEERWGNFDAERAGGYQVNDQFKLGRLNYR